MTRLEAINEILTSAGLFRVSAVQTGQPSGAGEAEAILDEVCRREENRPYFPMFRKSETLSPTLYEFTGATWTAATSRIAKVAAFADATVGQSILLTAPTTLTVTETTVTAVNDDYIEVEDEIYATDLGAVVEGEATTNRIYVEDGTVTVRSAGVDLYRRITQVGGYLYDSDNTTDQFSESIETERTVLLSFACIPEPIAAMISSAAASEFIRRWSGADKRLYRAQLEIELRRLGEANAYSNRQGKPAFTDSPSMRRMLGGRHGNAWPLTGS